VKLFAKYFGTENVGTCNNSKGFILQVLVRKEIIILDGFIYDGNIKSEFLKLLVRESILIDIKFKKSKEIKRVPTIILTR
jgi:hypothetical protein